MNDVEFEQLMRSQALGTLSPGERVRLDGLAANDPERARLVAEQDAVLATFAGERELAEETALPAEPGEEAHETMQRLTRVAASGEQDLRVRLLHGADVVRGAGQRPPWRRPLGFALLAAAAAVVLWFGFLREEGGIDTGVPDDLTAGTRLQLVLYNPTLTPGARKISWAAVAGASGYDVAILDRDGAVLEREVDLRKSTEWVLTVEQYAALLSQRPLRVRVTALDGIGAPIGSSGDLELGMR